MNDGFVNLLAANRRHAEKFSDRFDHVQERQNPSVVTVCCSDSRVLQDHMWGNDEPGAVFTCSNIGNRVYQNNEKGKVVSGDVLYPVAHTGTDTVVVVGHTGCGAVTATYRALRDSLDEPAGIEHCVELLKPDIEKGIDRLPEDVSETKKINLLVEWNVDRQVDFLLKSDQIPEHVDLVGGVYDFQDVYSDRRGLVHVTNGNGNRSVSELREHHPDIADRIQRLHSVS